uniref:CCHC-type domain-containing protein n=1 Tax=Chelydra serpentina TaxID=8475 RepID=A0A8C3S533_CHESE
MDPNYTGVFFAETPNVIPGWAPVSASQRKGADVQKGIREAQDGLWEVQEALREQMAQLAREQQALVRLLRREFGRNRRELEEKPGARARRPGADRRTCYACNRRGHVLRDCLYRVGGRAPQPQQGQREVPRAARRMKKPGRRLTCWACGQSGHVWRICPGPKQGVQGDPGKGSAPKVENRKHCPLRGTEGRVEEVPVGPVGPNVAEVVTGMEGTPQEAGTQTSKVNKVFPSFLGCLVCF